MVGSHIAAKALPGRVLEHLGWNPRATNCYQKLDGFGGVGAMGHVGHAVADCFDQPHLLI